MNVYENVRGLWCLYGLHLFEPTILFIQFLRRGQVLLGNVEEQFPRARATVNIAAGRFQSTLTQLVTEKIDFHI